MNVAGVRRILLTADAVGGVWQYVIDLATALSAHGVESVIAPVGPALSAAQRAQAIGVPGAALVEAGLPLDWLCDGPAPVLAAGARITAIAREHAVDLIHVNSPTLAAAAPAGLPVVAAAHGCVSTWWQAAAPGVPLDPALVWHRKLMGEGLRAADAVVAPSASYARLLHRHYGLAAAPTVVHNGRRPLARAQGAPHDCALTVGRLWDRAKNVAVLDRVAERLAVPFHAAGAATGPHGEHAATEHLHLLGSIDEAALADRLAARPVFVSAAVFEPFGLSVLEAANAGCALVLSDIRTFRELWNDAALFVEPGDADGYLAAIEALIGNSEARRALGEAAQARAARYTPAAMAEGMLRVYAGVAGPAAVQGQAA